VWTAARVVLGLIFAVLGMNGFVPFLPNPPTIPSVAAAFFGAIMTSHYSYLVFGVQALAGILLLVNRYVPLALVMLAAVIANILTFHLTMWPSTLVPMPIVVTVLWFVVAWPLREYFAPLLTAKT
jgi:hypothetical protein